jgi:hypothetical protein
MSDSNSTTMVFTIPPRTLITNMSRSPVSGTTSSRSITPVDSRGLRAMPNRSVSWLSRRELSRSISSVSWMSCASRSRSICRSVPVNSGVCINSSTNVR